MTVSDADRAAMARQALALKEAECDEEMEGEQLKIAIRWANEYRAAAGLPLFEEWMADDTEWRFHERARALGLLDRMG